MAIMTEYVAYPNQGDQDPQDPYEAFLADLQSSVEFFEAAELTAARMQVWLEDNGVRFSSEMAANEVDADDPDASCIEMTVELVSDAEVVAGEDQSEEDDEAKAWAASLTQMQTNYNIGILEGIATLIAQEQSQPSGVRPDARREVQARLVVLEMDDVWLAAVETELPGKSLDLSLERDAAMVEALRLQNQQNIQRNNELLSQSMTHFETLLTKAGGFELDESERTLMQLLAHQWASHTVSGSNNFPDRSNWAETVRVMLAQFDIPIDSRWQTIIDYK